MKTRIARLGGGVDLNLLVTFDAIFRWRKLTAAGRELGLSQPAMSHALARLRAVFDDPLFVRLPAGLQPTALAEELAPEVARGLAVLRGSLERKPFDPASATRVFRLRLGDIAEVVHLPVLVRELQAQAPHVRLHSTTLPEPQLADALAAGEVDLAVGNYALAAGCRERTLHHGDYACIARVGHPAIRRSLTLERFQAAQHVVVAPRGVSPGADVVRKVLASRKVRADIAAEVSGFHALLAMVATTDLVATLPRQLAEPMQRLAAVRVFEPPVAFARLRVALFWHERFHRDPGLVWLRELYIRVCGE